MGHHSHAHKTSAKEKTPLRDSWTLARKILAAWLILGAIATAISMFTLWPSDEQPTTSDAFETTSGLTRDLVEGTVAVIQPGMCNSPSVGKIFPVAPVTNPLAPNDCTHAIVDITSGNNAGQRTLLEIRPNLAGEPELKVSDKILLADNGQTDSPEQTQLGFQDYQRSTAMWIWGALAIVLIVLVGAWRGVRSLGGLAITIGVILIFLLPALVRGGSPVMLALTTGSAVLFMVLFLVHGFSWKSAAAMGGTLMSLGLAAVFSYFAVLTTGIRGLGDESNLHILLYLPGLNVSGLMLAGMIVGALGVLNDATVAQASTVHELHELDPRASKWRLFRSGMKVGQDHIASMVYTLILSYTGVALPTLLLLSLSGRSIEQILTSDVMSTELLRSITGAMALVLAMPLTTAIAALTVKNRERRMQDKDELVI